MPLFIPDSLSATGPQPFSTLKIQLQTAVDASRNRLHRYWQPAPGVGATVSTPFYFGEVEIAIRTLYYASSVKDVPGFQSTFGYLGWNTRLDLPWGWELAGGVGLGDNHLDFGKDEVNPMEEELCVRAAARLERPIRNDYMFTIEVSRELVFTYRRINLIFISAGVGHTIPAPGWFREFMR